MREIVEISFRVTDERDGKVHPAEFDKQLEQILQIVTSSKSRKVRDIDYVASLENGTVTFTGEARGSYVDAILELFLLVAKAVVESGSKVETESAGSLFEADHILGSDLKPIPPNRDRDVWRPQLQLSAS